MSDDLFYVLECHNDQTYDDPDRLVTLAHDSENPALAVAATVVLLNYGDPELHAQELVAIADVATNNVSELSKNWADFAQDHELVADPPYVHVALAALRHVEDSRYEELIQECIAGDEAQQMAALLALGDDDSEWAQKILRKENKETGDDAATASLLNAVALAENISWASAAALLFQEKDWSRRQAASFLRMAAELIADSEDLSLYDDLVELAEDESLPRGLRRFALGYALSFDLEPENDKEIAIQRKHVRRIIKVSKAGIVPLVETEVPSWFKGKVDVAVLD
ncbi:MAG: hypothetical protein ACRDAX_01380 [Propionibacteriaceae bacterium]